jgi:PEP-CTERM/exosortase A-associated glycosyltransferase
VKILHVFDHSIPLHSGYTFRSRNILRQQRARGWQTAHVTSSKHVDAAGPGAAEETVDGLHFYRTQPATGVRAKLPGFNQLAVVDTLAARLAEVIAKEKPDLLHAHSPALNGLAALRAGRRASLPVVYECRAFWEDAAVDHGTAKEGGLRYRLTRAMETKVFREVDAVFTICEGLRHDVAARGIPAGKITVIPNAVDIEDFSFGAQADPELQASLGLQGRTVLGFIGSFYAYEGLPLLLKALPAIRAQQPDVALLLVGGGPQDALLREQVQQLGLADTVIMTGRVPHSDVQRYYDLVDIFVYPRLSMRLTDLVTPLKPLEAMAQGRVVVASDVGGHKELIDDGKTGYLFKADSVDDLVSTALRALDQRPQWPQMHRAGRDFVEQERNWAASVANYALVYERLLGG